MVVDDSQSIRQMIAFSLKKDGIRVREAADGQEALDKLRTPPLVNMLVTDLDMPKIGGLELIRQVRAMPEYENIPVVVLTVKADAEIKAQARAAGANAWITKPFTPAQLANIINRFRNREA